MKEGETEYRKKGKRKGGEGELNKSRIGGSGEEGGPGGRVLVLRLK